MHRSAHASFARVAEVLDDAVARGEIAGSIAVVASEDELHLARCVGYADIETRAPMTMDTIVRVHSMSKPVTVAAFLTLVDEGRIMLGTRVADVLPELAALGPITIAHLCTHTSGLPYANPAGTRAERALASAIGDVTDAPQVDLATFTRRVGRTELAHAPGEAFTYGVSIDVLGRVAEVVSGTSLDAFLRARIFAPLGMHASGFGVSSASRVATMYRYDGTLTPYPLSSDTPTFLSGGGGLYASTRDYLAFARMLLSGGRHGDARVLSPESARRMRDPRPPSLGLREGLWDETLGAGCTFGLGVRVVSDPVASGYGSPGTFGWDGIAGTTFFVDPVARLVGLFVTQRLPRAVPLLSAFRAAVYDALTR